MNEQAYITGDFGKLAGNYSRGRRSVPPEILDFLWSLQSKKNPHILDVGCGTGIISREIADKGAIVTAVDIDPLMISVATENNPQKILYSIATADNLPFQENTFDVVVAFSAFHWFANIKSALEMKRVLRSDGLVFILNKNDVGDFSPGFREILRKFTIDSKLPDRKDQYKPQEVLSSAGFQNIAKKIFNTSEYFSVEEVLTYFQSVSGWDLVPSNLQNQALFELEKYARERMINGQIERKMELVMYYAYK